MARDRRRASGGAIAELDPTSQRELRTERAIVAGTERAVAKEERDAVAANGAARSLTQNPAHPIPADVVHTDALARLRAEQEQIIREIEASERGQAHSAKPQRMR